MISCCCHREYHCNFHRYHHTIQLQLINLSIVVITIKSVSAENQLEVFCPFAKYRELKSPYPSRSVSCVIKYTVRNRSTGKTDLRAKHHQKHLHRFSNHHSHHCKLDFGFRLSHQSQSMGGHFSDKMELLLPLLLDRGTRDCALKWSIAVLKDVHSYKPTGNHSWTSHYWQDLSRKPGYFYHPKTRSRKNKSISILLSDHTVLFSK